MTLSNSELKKWAKKAEQVSYFPVGRKIDGAPYSYARIMRANDNEDFLIQASDFFTTPVLEEKVRLMNGDPLCGNWMLWASFCLLEVARVTE